MKHLKLCLLSIRTVIKRFTNLAVSTPETLPNNIESKFRTAANYVNPFPKFPFTGSLRPVYPLSPKRPVPESIPHPDYAKDGIPMSERKWGRNNIAILDKKQQDGMRKVCRLAREVLDIAAREVKPGITTDYLDEVVHKACLERDVSTAPREWQNPTCFLLSLVLIYSSHIPRL